jgi:hypothetical protein
VPAVAAPPRLPDGRGSASQGAGDRASPPPPLADACGSARTRVLVHNLRLESPTVGGTKLSSSKGSPMLGMSGMSGTSRICQACEDRPAGGAGPIGPPCSTWATWATWATREFDTAKCGAWAPAADSRRSGGSLTISSTHKCWLAIRPISGNRPMGRPWVSWIPWIRVATRRGKLGSMGAGDEMGATGQRATDVKEA